MKKILAVLVGLFLVFSIIVFPVMAAEPAKLVVLAKDQTINSDYFGAGQEVTISGTVNGDAYVAGGTVIIDGTINGDLLTAGGNVTVSGTVRNNIRAAGGNVNISGATVGGNITSVGGQINIDSATRLSGSVVAGGGNIQIFAAVPRGITIGGGNVVLGSVVGKDVTAGVGTLTLTQNADVRGALTYWSEQKANIAQGATISGMVKHELPKREETRANEIGKNAAAAAVGAIAFLKIYDTIVMLLVGLALIMFFPIYFGRAVGYTRTNFGWALLIGFAVLVLTPMAAVILLVTLVGIPLAIIIIFLYFLLLWLARIFAIAALGTEIVSRTNTKIGAGWAYALGLVIYFILSLIPIISFVTDFLILLAGLGTVVAMKNKYYTELRTKKLI